MLDGCWKYWKYFPKTKVIQWNPNLCKYFIPGQFSNLLLSRVSLSWDCEYESWLWFVLRQPNEKLRAETSRGRERWWGTISGGGGGETHDLQHLTVEAKFTNCFSVGIVLLLKLLISSEQPPTVKWILIVHISIDCGDSDEDQLWVFSIYWG